MIPLRPAVSDRRWPLVTWAVIVFDVAFFAWAALSADAATIWDRWAFTPVRFFAEPLSTGGLPTLFGSLFLHAGWLHLGGNMLYLAAFGPIAESRLGHTRFALLFLASGAAGMLAQGLAFPASEIPVVGASGAIAGVLGATLLLAPKTKVTTAVPAFVTIEMAELPAGFLVGAWVLMQVAGSIGTIAPGAGSIAWLAHAGGLVSGGALAAALGRRR